MKKMIAAVFAVALAMTANAAVTFDPETGGTVGKGDVQSACGWNDDGLQNAWNLGQITFKYDNTEATVDTDTCLKIRTGNNKVLDPPQVHGTRTTTVYSGATLTSGKDTTGTKTTGNNKKITGFLLQPATIYDSGTPVVVSTGDFAACAGGSDNFALVDGQPISTGIATDGKLRVYCSASDSVGVVIWEEAIAVDSVDVLQ